MFLFLVLVLVLVFGGESVVRFNDSGGAFKSGRSGLAVYRPSRLGPGTAGSSPAQPSPNSSHSLVLAYLVP